MKQTQDFPAIPEEALEVPAWDMRKKYYRFWVNLKHQLD